MFCKNSIKQSCDTEQFTGETFHNIANETVMKRL